MKYCFLLLLVFAAFGASAQRILSYNIRNAKGMDNQTDYDRIATAILQYQPEVVALQELDSVTIRSKGTDVLKILANKTGMHYTFSASIDYNGGKYGIGILSKEKPLRVHRVALPGKEELRSLLIAEFNDYVLFNTHLSLTPADQLRSVDIINRQQAAYNKPIYLAGDLNALPGSETVTALSAKWELLSGTGFTFPADRPDRCIDYIFGHTLGKKVAGVSVPEQPLASDHRPVLLWMH